MSIVVTNEHHFCEGVELVITDGRVSWRVNRQGQQTEYDPSSSLNDFIECINLAFEFTGCARRIVCGDLTLSEIVNAVYSTPLEQSVRFVYIMTCTCDMGNCGAVNGVEICDTEYETYGDVIKLLSFNQTDTVDGAEYYEYPDSVLLRLRRITSLPDIYTNCHGSPTPCTLTLDPEVVYISYAYLK